MDYEPSAAFIRIAEQGEDELDLARAALEIARDEYPSLDSEAIIGQLITLTERAKALSEDSDNPIVQMRAINTCLFKELGLSGNSTAYFDPRNSYLNDVLERKVGIPITLSVVYLDVGWRLGLPLVGVGFPGHFLVKCHIGDSVVVVDPFHRGLSLDEHDLLKRLEEMFGARDDLADHLPRFLGSVSKHEMVLRMLRNLKMIFVKEKRHERALAASNKLCLLAPNVAEEYRDRAATYEALDCFSAAAVDYRQYLELTPAAADVLEVKQRLMALEKQASRLN